MVQNRSSAVMQQRTEAIDALDDFPTPPWATRAAIELLEPLWDRWSPVPLRALDAREPCANRGYMVRPLRERFAKVIASDVHDYGAGFPLGDYLFPGEMEPANIVCMNPPFNMGPEFILKSFETPGWLATAAIVRTSFLEGKTRYERLFSQRPPTLIAQHVERVIMHKGTVRDPDKLYWDGAQWKKPSTATSYCWLFWLDEVPPQPFAWIPPCRRRLERPGDYDNITIEASNRLSDGGQACTNSQELL